MPTPLPPSPTRLHTFGSSLLPDNTIINRVYDAQTDTLCVNLASGSITLIASLGSVKLEDAVNPAQKLSVLADGSINVNVALAGPADSVALTDPTGSLITPALDSTLMSIRDTAGIYQIQQPVNIGTFPSVSVATTPAGYATLTTASITVMATNASRKFATFVNDSSGKIYLALGGTAVMGRGIPLLSEGGSFEITMMNLYTGVVSAIAELPNSNLAITEA
jgi:hypothetical protein